MNCRNIKFAKEVCFNVQMNEEAEWVKKNNVYEYFLNEEDVFLYSNDLKDRKSVRLSLNNHIQDYLNELKLYYGKALFRVDDVNQKRLQITLLEFADVKTFTKEDPMTIVVDQAAESVLRKNRIEPEKAVAYIQKQLLVNHTYAFAYGNPASERIELLGERYFFELEKTPQGYLHIVGMRQRKNANNVESQIVLLSGCILIENQLTDKSVLTKMANEQYQALVQNNSEFIRLWDLYDQTELESIRNDAAFMGYLEYSGYKYSGGKLVFDIVGLVDSTFLVDDMSYAVMKKEGFDKTEFLNNNTRGVIVLGSNFDRKCNGTAQFIIEDETDTTKEIPSTGYIVPSIQGSRMQSKRRQIARDNVLKGKCGMPGLKNIIQAGTITGISGKHRNAVTSNLEKKMLPAGAHFTELQKAAIEAAINTPDIAVIQGPPGTGKTTVIRAIINRIDELENGLAKILISSTQHDAVDNAAQKVVYGGVPANRVANRKSENEEIVSMYGWIDDMIKSCEKWLLKNDEENKRSVVREIFRGLVAIEKAEKNDWKTKYSELNHIYLQCLKLIMNAALMNECSRVLTELRILAEEQQEENPLKQLLAQQRLDVKSYLEDGKEQLKKLEMYLKYESGFEFGIPEYWRTLKRIKNEDDQLSDLIKMFADDIKKLQKMAGNSEDASDDHPIHKQLTEVICSIRAELVSMQKDEQQKIADLVWGFKQSLTSPNSVKGLIESYSKVNAATCQQAVNRFLSPAMKGWNEEYDYVIIDEAARSNPLDILIPMSLGKKIILVGDHKQLPHMLEPDIVKAVTDKTKMQDAELILKESLFMRLYNNIAEEDRKNGSFQRTCMLQEQYRMHPDISDLVNIFYDGRLQSVYSKEEKAHNLGLYENKALAWIDVPASEKMPYESPAKSKSRECEVEVVLSELTKIRGRNAEATIGIISFYSKQVDKLRTMVDMNFPTDYNISVGTVDAFQGKEFDIVILSTVRSNMKNTLVSRVGFLNNDNRLCVAFSRAKKLLVTVGDAGTVAQDDKQVYIKALSELYNKCKKGDGYYACV